MPSSGNELEKIGDDLDLLVDGPLPNSRKEEGATDRLCDAAELFSEAVKVERKSGLGIEVRWWLVIWRMQDVE